MAAAVADNEILEKISQKAMIKDKAFGETLRNYRVPVVVVNQAGRECWSHVH